jgi:hypothetical protein
VIRRKIGAPDIADEERVAREDRPRPSWPAKIGHRDRDALGGMAGSLQELGIAARGVGPRQAPAVVDYSELPTTFRRLPY